MSDRADEIARETVRSSGCSVGPCGPACSCVAVFAAALRAYGAECVQEFRMRVMHGDTGSTNTIVTSGSGGCGMLPESQP